MLILVHGAKGSGLTLFSCYKALDSYKNKKYKKIEIKRNKLC